MPRHVRGSFFADYVRMIRRRKDVDWNTLLTAEELEFVRRQVDPHGWYPMTVFERLGEAILAHNAAVTLSAVRMWGHASVSAVIITHPELIAPGDPVESLMRLKVLRASLFDFSAFDIPELSEGHARIEVNYRMGKVAEEAACYQTLGFCEGVVALAGGRQILGSLAQCSWDGHAQTSLLLEWQESP